MALNRVVSTPVQTSHGANGANGAFVRNENSAATTQTKTSLFTHQVASGRRRGNDVHLNGRKETGNAGDVGLCEIIRVLPTILAAHADG